MLSHPLRGGDRCVSSCRCRRCGGGAREPGTAVGRRGRWLPQRESGPPAVGALELSGTEPGGGWGQEEGDRQFLGGWALAGAGAEGLLCLWKRTVPHLVLAPARTAPGRGGPRAAAAAKDALFSRQMKGALTEIIQLATLDSDPWVLMVADILKSFPDTGSLNLDLEEQNPNVQDILGELREKGTCWASGRSRLCKTQLVSERRSGRFLRPHAARPHDLRNQPAAPQPPPPGFSDPGSLLLPFPPLPSAWGHAACPAVARASHSARHGADRGRRERPFRTRTGLLGGAVSAGTP